MNTIQEKSLMIAKGKPVEIKVNSTEQLATPCVLMKGEELGPGIYWEVNGERKGFWWPSLFNNDPVNMLKAMKLTEKMPEINSEGYPTLYHMLSAASGDIKDSSYIISKIGRRAFHEAIDISSYAKELETTKRLFKLRKDIEEVEIPAFEEVMKFNNRILPRLSAAFQDGLISESDIQYLLNKGRKSPI